MIFRQLIDAQTSSYSYLLADEQSGEAVLIDAVREQVDRDVQLVEELGLHLLYALETHVHADHVTGGGLLRKRLGCRLAVGERAGVLTADRQLRDGDRVSFGPHALEVRATPGHTDGCVSYVCHEEGMAFTGDALLIRGCGRTDFQGGDAGALYTSVTEKILSLPPATRLYPAHDYRGRTASTVAEERRFNPRLREGRSREDFVAIMNALDLALPQRIDEAVPGNMASGLTEPEPAAPSDAPGDAWAPVLRTASGAPSLESAWVAEHLPELRLIDVREHPEFCGPLGHLEGAQLVPLARLLDVAGDWDRDRPVITVCAYGTRSEKAAQLLEAAGFSRVASLRGGMRQWRETGGPVVEVMGGRDRQDAELWRGMGI